MLLAGRSGRFWYNNMDHSIGQGLTMSDKILKGQILSAIDTSDREFWAAASEGESAEEPQNAVAAPKPTGAGS